MDLKPVLVEKSSTTNTGLRSMRHGGCWLVLNQSERCVSLAAGVLGGCFLLSGEFSTNFIHVEFLEFLNQIIQGILG